MVKHSIYMTAWLPEPVYSRQSVCWWGGDKEELGIEKNEGAWGGGGGIKNLIHWADILSPDRSFVSI